VCKVFGSYDEGKFVYVVMEYLEGGDVFDRLLEEGHLPESQAADVIKQVASALKYAHTRGIAHRDLKPENVVFCSKDKSDHHLKVIDWGVSSQFGVKKMKSQVGSVDYAAPEVVSGKGYYSAACDLWSLGVLIYTMLHGQAPLLRAQTMGSGGAEDGTCSTDSTQSPLSAFGPVTSSGMVSSSTETLASTSASSSPRAPAASSLNLSEQPQISNQAKALIRGLVQRDPGQRLSIDEVLTHPWLSSAGQQAKVCTGPSPRILANLQRFSGASRFFSLVVASATRQLDFRRLEDLRRAFNAMDTNGDGVLELHEVRASFEQAFGRDSEEFRGVDEMFARLDLDHSGTVEYTEFCAAGLGELSPEGTPACAAFKAFDVVKESDGRITKEDLAHVLASASAGGGADTPVDIVCWERTAERMIRRFDSTGDGCLDFGEWLRLLQEHKGGTPKLEYDDVSPL